jgi:hypothetical protein
VSNYDKIPTNHFPALRYYCQEHDDEEEVLEAEWQTIGKGFGTHITVHQSCLLGGNTVSAKWMRNGNTHNDPWAEESLWDIIHLRPRMEVPCTLSWNNENQRLQHKCYGIPISFFRLTFTNAIDNVAVALFRVINPLPTSLPVLDDSDSDTYIYKLTEQFLKNMPKRTEQVSRASVANPFVLLQSIRPCRHALAVSGVISKNYKRVCFPPIDKDSACDACNDGIVLDLGDNVIGSSTTTPDEQTFEPAVQIDDVDVMRNDAMRPDDRSNSDDDDDDGRSSISSYSDDDDDDDMSDRQNVYGLPETVHRFLQQKLPSP